MRVTAAAPAVAAPDSAPAAVPVVVRPPVAAPIEASPVATVAPQADNWEQEPASNSGQVVSDRGSALLPPAVGGEEGMGQQNLEEREEGSRT